ASRRKPPRRWWQPAPTCWSPAPPCSGAAIRKLIGRTSRRCATQPPWRAARRRDGPALQPSGHGGNLGAADPVSHLVRDRGARRRRDGEARTDSEKRRENDLG